MFIIYGPGGIGKSAIVNIFREIVGQTYDLQNNLIVEDSKSFKQNITPQDGDNNVEPTKHIYLVYLVHHGPNFNHLVTD